MKLIQVTQSKCFNNHSLLLALTSLPKISGEWLSKRAGSANSRRGDRDKHRASLPRGPGSLNLQWTRARCHRHSTGSFGNAAPQNTQNLEKVKEFMVFPTNTYYAFHPHSEPKDFIPTRSILAKMGQSTGI